MPDEKPARARVQGEHRDRNGSFIRPVSEHIPPGTIDWAEHEIAWKSYARKYGEDQSALRIHERQGFGYWELCDYLGYHPRTWKPLNGSGQVLGGRYKQDSQS